MLYHSVQFGLSVMSDSLRPHESQHTRPPCPSPTPGVHSDSCPLSPWCHPAISSWVVPFSSCPQSLPASESFPMSQLFAWGVQSTGASVLASFLPKKSQGWSPSEWTGWISLQSKGPSKVFSNTTVQMHQVFGAQSSSQYLTLNILFLLLFPSPFFLLLFIIFILISWKTYWDINLCFHLIGDWKKTAGENFPSLHRVLKGLCVVGLPSCLLPPPGICLRNLLREVSIWAGEGDSTGPIK